MVDSNNARESVFEVTFAVANLFLVHCSDPGCMGVQWPDRQRHDYLIDGIVPEESGQIFKIAYQGEQRPLTMPEALKSASGYRQSLRGI